MCGTKVLLSEIYWANIVLAGASAIVGVLLIALGTGWAAKIAVKDKIMLSDFFIIGLNLLPVALLTLGLSALFLGFLPKLGNLVYVYIASSFFVNYFGRMLNLPKWISKTAPQNWLPNLPAEQFNLKIYIFLIALSLLLTVIGYLGYKNRDLLEGS